VTETTNKHEPSAEEITLNTIREHAERTVELTASAERGTFAAGRRAEARDVLAIVAMNGRPPNEPVIFESALDS
jgi:hypothetical protein